MQLLVASDDDLNPVIYSWDLRNARAPEKTLHGHEKGVLSLAWCPKDPELLLSSGKDGKAVCWNPKAGSVVSEVIHSQNWLFDVQWCPRNPDVFSVASFAGHIDIYSFQAIMSGGSSSKASNAFASDATPEGFFASNVPGASNTKSTSVSGIMQIPKWLRRPTSVSFGFGGRIVSFSANSGGGKRISITSIPDESAKKIANQSARLDTVLCSQQSAVFADFCSSKIETPVTSLRTDQNTGSQISDSVFWSVAKVLFEEDPREKLMYLLGFDKQKLESQLKKLTLVEERSHPRTPNSSTVLLEHQQSHFKSNPIKKLDLGIDNHIAENDSKGVDFFASLTGKTFNSVQDNPNENGEIDFSSLINSENTLNHEFSQDNAILSQSNKNSAQEAASDSYSVPFPLLPADGNEIDCAITRAIVLGNFEAAVELLVKAERLSDALLVAMCGGEQLVHATHEKYFIQSASSYLRVISGVVRKDLTDIVMNADSSHWEEILALICSYAPNTSAFTRFCRILAGRIEKIYPHAAMLVYMAGGDAPSAASILLSTPVKLPTSAVEESTRLESIIEKIRIMEQTAHQSQLSMTDIVPGRVDSSIYEHTDSPDHLAPIQEMVPAVSEMYLKYAKLMAEIGMLQVSAKYFNSFTGSLSPELIVFGDQLSKSVGYLNIPLRPVEDPFQADRLFITSENDAVVPNLQASGHGLNSLTTNLPYDSQSIQKQLHRDSFSSSNYGMQQHTSSHSVNPEPHHSYTQHNQIPPNHQFGAINQQHPVLPPIAPIQAPYQNYRDPSNVYSQHDSAIPPHFQSPTTGNMGSNQMQNHIQPFAFPPQSSQTLNINTQQNQTHNLHQASSVPSAHQISSKVPGVVNAHLPSPYLPTPSAAPSTTTQPHQNGSAPPIPNQSHPMLLAVSQPLQPQVPMIPLPSDINNYQKSTPPVQLPLASGSYNDAPVVAPRIPSAPIHATMHPSAFVPSPLANLEPPKTSSPLLPALPGNKPVGNSHPHQSQQTSKAPTTATNSGPVDSSQIPPNLMPIYKTINTLILKCQEQAMVSLI